MMLLLHMSQTLDAISLNELVEIAAISNDAIAPKLSEMGLTKGQKIKAIFKAPFGDPIAYEINGNQAWCAITLGMA